MTAARTAPSVDLSMLLNQAGYALTSRLSAALEELGISVRIYCVLAKAAEGEYTQGQLAELAWMDKTTMVVTLDEMEARGLAERRHSPGDRRVRVIAITPQGRSLLGQADRDRAGPLRRAAGRTWRRASAMLSWPSCSSWSTGRWPRPSTSRSPRAGAGSAAPHDVLQQMSSK